MKYFDILLLAKAIANLLEAWTNYGFPLISDSDTNENFIQ